MKDTEENEGQDGGVQSSEDKSCSQKEQSSKNIQSHAALPANQRHRIGRGRPGDTVFLGAAACRSGAGGGV